MAYQYEPLLSPDSFRLLLLQPSASYNDELEGTLFITTISERDEDLIDKYTALSYVWGSSEKPCQIRLDGRAVAITTSLDDALRNMRDARRGRNIWADAICINQGNTAERSSQVGLMGEIYSVADRTVIYLGDLTRNMSDIFTVAAAEATRKSRTLAADSEEKSPLRITKSASREIMSRPWFTRVWVIQELVFSEDPWVQFQDQRMRWRAFCQLLLGESDSNQDVEQYLQALKELDINRSEDSRFTLFEALKARRGLGATDPRDLVYANLSIIKDLDTVSQYVQVDYDKPVSWVFSQVGAYVCKTLGFEVLISYLEDGDGEQRLEALPSWIPDWSQFTLDTARPLSPNEIKVLQGQLDLGSFSFWNKDVPLVLGQIGFELDVVASVSGIVPPAYDLDAASAQRHAEITYKLSENIIDKRWKYNLCHNLELTPAERLQKKEYLSFMRTTWARLLLSLKQPSSDEVPEDDEFIAAFLRWAWTSCRSMDIVSHPQLGVGYHVQEYLETNDSESPIAGRRLAMTQTGHCVIVPARTRKGDMISGFLDAALPVVLRAVDQPRDSQVSDVIIGESQRSWTHTVFQAVEHVSIIGKCYTTSSDLRWCRVSLEKLRLFALH